VDSGFWTSQYLKQAGVWNAFVPLDERGIEGNGHMMMLEKNNRAIAWVIHNWLKNNVASAASGVADK
jgi:hypothetical protein